MRAKREEFLQLISWGHWFTFVNVIFCIIIGSQYVVQADWPSTFLGRLYAIFSSIGQFGFLGLLLYLISLFLLSLLFRSFNILRVFACIISSVAISLLLIDLAVYTHFRLHLNSIVLDILLSPQNETILPSFIIQLVCFVLIFAVEWGVATLLWNRYRKLRKIKPFAKIGGFFILFCFFAFHLLHMWADANFYRPITMQRTTLPFSYPLTARHLLEKYGLYNNTNALDESIARDAFSLAVEYPLSPLVYGGQFKPYNVVIVVVDQLSNDHLNENMPNFAMQKAQNLDFVNHYTTSDENEFSAFSLFYSLTPNYYNGILLARKNTVLFDALNYYHYLVGLFSSQGFDSPLYKQALLANFSLPKSQEMSNKHVIQQWQEWVKNANQTRPWFSFVELSLTEKPQNNHYLSTVEYKQKSRALDQQLKTIFDTLENENALDNTIVVVTAHHGVERNDKTMQIEGYHRRYDLSALKVPFMLHWPQKAPQQLTQRTSHIDVVSTLMKSLFMVKTDLNKLSLGRNLVQLGDKNDGKTRWITAGDNDEMLILTNNQVIVFDRMNQFKVFDAELHQESNEKLDLSLLLQILIENRRFIIY